MAYWNESGEDVYGVSYRAHATNGNAHARRVILKARLQSTDCGAHGGLAGGSRGNTRAEAAHHQRELALAASNLLQAIPGIEVQG
jgi:hypothetical protein